jgi:DNA-binding SARP family transcriptional activator
VRAGLQLRLLGPFEVRLDGGEAVPLGGLRQRAVLAILTLRANTVVSTDRLVDELWGEQPPATAVHTVQVFVSRLRNALGPAGERLVTRPPGYALELGTDEVDAERCEHLYSSARTALAAGEPDEAAELLRDAMALWSGSPLAEFTYEPFAQAAIARLEELRVSCREELIEAELALGRHAQVIPELESFVREQPFRERPRGQLMLALYRSGRQAEALDAFQHARRALVEELGVEPSDALRKLEQAVLEQDESLRAPSGPAAPPPSKAVELAEGRDSHTPVPTEESVPAGGAAQREMVRKTATVLVANIEPAAHADPERVRTLLRTARNQAKADVSRHGGTFVAGLGGEVVAVFGLPATREDDPLRALRAAHELRAHVARLATGASRELVTRVGVDTGEVVADAAGDLFGEPLTQGIALSRAAQHGEVLLSDSTRRSASDAIRIERTADGTGWRLLDVVPGTSTRQPRRGGAMFGRDAELSAAHAAFALTSRTGKTHLLTLIGEAGIGKSRLSEELVNQLEDQATVLRGRCLSYGEGIALWPLHEALTGAAGGESREAIRGLLGDEQDADLVADIVAAAIGLSAAEDIGEQVPWAFRTLLGVLARRRPVLLVIDDTHWGGQLLLDLIDYLIDWLTAPALVVCLARPELLELRPAWGGGHAQVSSIVLGRLDEQDALRLLGDRLGDRRLSAEDSARILETAEGNPLFVEQLLAMSAEDPWWSQKSQVPATLQALLAARLDRLGPGERALIERAAVIGRGFWPAALVEMLPAEAQASADQHLRALVHRGLIHPDRSSLPGEEELSFHHILIRDVAYRSTSKALRGELHERFGDWLARRGEKYDEFVGHHLKQAFGYRSELGVGDGDTIALAGRAGDHLFAAGRRAALRGDPNAAVRLLQGAAEMFRAANRRRPDVLLELGTALCDSGELRDAERELQAALEQARSAESDAIAARALIELSDLRAVVDPSARVEETEDVARRAIAVFIRAGDEGGLSRAWLHLADIQWTRCCYARMEEVLEEALTHAQRAGDHREEARALGYLARAATLGPRPVADAIQRCTDILGRAGDDVHLTALVETMLAVLEAMRGSPDAARERWQRTTRRLDDVGLNITVQYLQMYRALIELASDPALNIEQDLAQACALLDSKGERSRMASIAALLARLLYINARYGDSLRYGQISAEAASVDDVASTVWWQGTHARLVAREGDESLAEEIANSAIALAEQTDFILLRGDSLRDRADVLTILGRPEQATHELERAAAMYERKGIVVLAASARRYRDSLATPAHESGPA